MVKGCHVVDQMMLGVTSAAYLHDKKINKSRIYSKVKINAHSTMHRLSYDMHGASLSKVKMCGTTHCVAIKLIKYM